MELEEWNKLPNNTKKLLWKKIAAKQLYELLSEETLWPRCLDQLEVWLCELIIGRNKFSKCGYKPMYSGDRKIKIDPIIRDWKEKNTLDSQSLDEVIEELKTEFLIANMWNE